MLNRRRFITQSALVSLTPWIPAFVSGSLANETSKKDERILVVVQLDGGNDGLNTVIPYADDNYARFRRELLLPSRTALKLDDHVGLHPAMSGLHSMFSAGDLTVIQGVGYPNPDRSHFRSMAIWHQAQRQVDENAGYGWLGRSLDEATPVPQAAADAVFVGTQSIPQALWGKRSQVVSMNQARDLLLRGEWKALDQPSAGSTSELDEFVRRTLDRSYRISHRMKDDIQHSTSDGSNYPDSDLSHQLALISTMIKGELSARVYYVSQPGYDTHASQLGDHDRLLRTFSAAVKAFFDDLTAAKLHEQVVLLAFSEFGRRVAENESGGTDHGTAGPVFLAGPATIGGLVNPHPSLTELDDGDLKMSVDFRAVYACLIADWLQLPSPLISTQEFPGPRLFKA